MPPPNVNLNLLGEAEETATPHLSSLDEAKKLSPGTAFIAPDGKKRVVPYEAKTPEEADTLPEGVQFVDPSGKMRTTPKYEALDFTAQTLYSMAATAAERKKALERSYPGKVKQHPRTGEYYVEEEGGVRRRSKGIKEAPGGFLASQAAPVVGSVLGEIGGGIAGTAVAPGAGTLGGAIAGGAAGGAAGQAFNDAVLALAGVYDRTGGQEVGELGIAAALGGAGTAVGRGVAAAAPLIKEAAVNAPARVVGKFIGAQPEELSRAIGLREQKVLTPISSWAKEAPHFINLSEVLDPAMRTWKPLTKSASEYYEREGAKILETVGVKKPSSLLDPEASVSTQEAGEAILARGKKLAEADNSLQRTVMETQRAIAEEKAGGQQANLEALRATERETRAAADRVIADGFKAIDADIKKAMDAVKAGLNSGDLWTQAATKLRNIRAAIGARASQRYAIGDQLAGDNLPDITGLPEQAAGMLAELPEGFAGRYPSIVKQIRDLAGTAKINKETGAIEGWEKEPVNPTFGQLRNLRTVLRNNVNYYDLTPDFREGAFKFFATRVNEVLHDPNAGSELRAAAVVMDATDAWYGKVIRPLTDKNIQAVVNGIESGMPADPKLLYETVVKQGRSELTNKIRKLVGPNLWSAIRAADVQEMIDQSKTLSPGAIDGRRFAKQVLDRFREGSLESVHGEGATKLMEQARLIEALDGRLDIATRSGDTITDIIGRARLAADAAKEAGKKDPLAVLNKEMKAIAADNQRMAAKMRRERLADPLGFLYNPTTTASEAVNRILGSEDLTIAAAAKFGQKSPEYNMLRQVWVQRILQGTMEPGKKLEGVSEEVQRLMLPGVTLDQMRLFASNMDFLMGTRAAAAGTGRSIMATSVVENPWSSHMPFDTGHTAMRKVIGGNFVGRAILTKYFAFVTEVTNNIALMRWIEKGLRGDDTARAMVREEVQRRMGIGGPIGAAVGESIGQRQ